MVKTDKSLATNTTSAGESMPSSDGAKTGITNMILTTLLDRNTTLAATTLLHL